MTPADMAADLAARFHLRRRARSWGGDCPVCSYYGAFSLKVSAKFKRPTLYCANGCPQDRLAKAAQDVLGAAWTPPPPADPATVEQARARKAAAALKLWAGSDPVAGTIGERYLVRRGLGHLGACSELRFRGDCWHPDGSRRPALIAAVRDVAGELRAVHRTYLTPDGSKAKADPPKASLGPVWECAIRLAPMAEHIVIGEGLETAASAGLLMGLPAWAAISAGNMARAMKLPEAVRTVTIAGDPDRPGRRAVDHAVARHRFAGLTVRLAMPDEAGVDFNDLLLRRGAHAR